MTGQLNLTTGGPSDDLDNLRSAARRTVYGKVSRQRPSDVHRLFDLPDPKACTGEKRGGDDHTGPATLFPQQPLRSGGPPRSLPRRSEGICRGRSESVIPACAPCVTRPPTSARPWNWCGRHERATRLHGSCPQALLVSNEFLFLNWTRVFLDVSSAISADLARQPRRQFIRELGGSVGLLGLASYLKASEFPRRRPSPARKAALPAASQAGHLPVHGWWAVAPRHVRPETRARQARRKRLEAADLRTRTRVRVGYCPRRSVSAPAGSPDCR